MTRPDPQTIPTDRLPSLHAGRLRLRWLTEDDVDALFTVFADPAVTRFWSWPAFTRVEQAAALLEQIRGCFLDDRLYQWGIARSEDDRVIGTCTLANLDFTHARAEIGFALGSAHWRQGWMWQACSALLDLAFGPLGLLRLEADVDPQNTASLALLERLGFQREGYQRERWRVGGQAQDSVLLGLLARERPPR